MRGYNDSDKPAGVAAYDLDILADDVRALVKELGHTSCTLVSHDWGGVVAWYAAASARAQRDPPPGAQTRRSHAAAS